MASNKMSYCSLEEAWGEEYANLYKKDDSMMTMMPQGTIDNKYADTTILKDRSLTRVSTPIDRNNIDKDIEKFYNNKKNELTKCQSFLEHFLECEECKKKINDIFKPQRENQTKSFIENFNFKSNFDESYLDILVLILIGIFIIFILDCFVRLGRTFRR